MNKIKSSREALSGPLGVTERLEYGGEDGVWLDETLDADVDDD